MDRADLEMDTGPTGSAHAGDPVFHQITEAEIAFYDKKNYDYAGGGSDPNGNFNRVSTILALYSGLSLADPRVVALVYMMKQLDQVLFSLSRGFEGAIEGIDERMTDVHVYAKIVRVLDFHIRKEGCQVEKTTDSEREHGLFHGWKAQ